MRRPKFHARTTLQNLSGGIGAKTKRERKVNLSVDAQMISGLVRYTIQCADYKEGCEHIKPEKNIAFFAFSYDYLNRAPYERGHYAHAQHTFFRHYYERALARGRSNYPR